MPGEQVPEVEDLGKSKKVVLGPGLRRVNESVLACKAGIVCKKEPNLFWIDSYQRRYVPVRGECVLGVVTQKSGDIFRVAVGAHEQACLSYLAFEGATKKNRPDIQVGDLLYARLIVASRDLEPEIVCVNSHGKKEKLGVLNDGFVFNCSINLIRKVFSIKFASSAQSRKRNTYVATTYRDDYTPSNKRSSSKKRQIPSIKDKAGHDSRTTTSYGGNFFRRFDWVQNAFDNRLARLHVTRMCLTVAVLLVESDTEDLNEQIELIKKTSDEGSRYLAILNLQN